MFSAKSQTRLISHDDLVSQIAEGVAVADGEGATAPTRASQPSARTPGADVAP